MRTSSNTGQDSFERLPNTLAHPPVVSESFSDGNPMTDIGAAFALGLDLPRMTFATSHGIFAFQDPPKGPKKTMADELKAIRSLIMTMTYLILHDPRLWNKEVIEEYKKLIKKWEELKKAFEKKVGK